MRERREKRRSARLERMGRMLENSLDHQVENSLRSWLLRGTPLARRWYRVPVAGGLTADGSPYHFYFRLGSEPRKLCVFLSGGGIAWDDRSASNPSDMGRIAAGEPHYYWSNLRPVTEILNIGAGIVETRSRRNPFRDWSFLLVTYATGDMHIGKRDYSYCTEKGEARVLHFHGYGNFRAAMDAGAAFLPMPEKLLIAGDSAGAFAVAALADEIIGDYFPACRDVTLLSDSGLLLSKNWKKIVRDVWGADEKYWGMLRGNDLLADWYRSLHEKRGDSLRYLYAGSTRDYMLAAYYNAMKNDDPSTGPAVQRKFFQQYCHLVKKLRDIEPRFQFYVNDIKNMLTRGGTIHTAVRYPFFIHRPIGGVSMADWLSDAVNGREYSVGLELLKTKQGGNQ